MGATVAILVVIFIATLIRSTFGFGEALVAVPLLALFLPVKQSAPLAVLLSITVALVVVVQDWRKIHLKATGWLLAPTFVAIPAGVLLLRSAHQGAMKAALGVLIAGFAAFFLVGKNPPQLHDDHHAWMIACGLVAGVLGGAFGMNGPPLVLYGAMRRWSPPQFRATLQGYFLPASVVAMGGYWLAGLWTPAVTHDYLVALPAALPAIFLGRWINHRLRGDAFLRYVYAGLLCIGVALLVQALRHN